MRVLLSIYLQELVFLASCYLLGSVSSTIESECVTQCEVDDSVCLQVCAREYALNLKNCPCEENCPEGCPCKEYECPTRNTWSLVINTRDSKNSPLVVDGYGQSKEIDFSYQSQTEAFGSCSVVWNGKMHLFGGSFYKRQISVVDQCQLKKIGELTFDMFYGACAQRNDAKIYICFEAYNNPATGRNCRQSDAPLDSFSQLPSSNYNHQNTRIAATAGELLCCISLQYR